MLVPLFMIYCSRCVHIGGKGVHAVFPDKFMTHSLLDFIDMKDTHIIYDHYYLKFNLEKNY